MAMQVVSFDPSPFHFGFMVAKVVLDVSHWVFRFLPRSTIITLINVNIYLSIIDAIWWHSWLKHCTKSRKVAGLISDGAFGIFH
jgi:hypothetical protein